MRKLWFEFNDNGRTSGFGVEGNDAGTIAVEPPRGVMSKLPACATAKGSKSGRAIREGDAITEADGDLVLSWTSVGGELPPVRLPRGKLVEAPGESGGPQR